jgi:N-acetylglucosamine-6-phosphate deacetylase
MKAFGRHYASGDAIELEIADGRIVACRPRPARAGEKLSWLAPGLIDLQVNGYGGTSFTSPELSTDDVHRLTQRFEAFGVVRFCPTLTTASFATLSRSLRVLAKACDESAALRRRLPGVHLEGPYISPEDGARGAHPKDHVRPPDWNEFQRLQELAGGRIRILTMSPEYEGSETFIEKAAASGVVVAIGHTSAAPGQIHAAASAGARMSTHLGNGSHAMMHRHRNYVWAQLADDRLAAGLIVDGHHLPADVVKTFVRAKKPARCILVSDLSSEAGRPAGRYQCPLGDVEILPDGRLVVAGQREALAGAAHPLGACVANAVRLAEVDLAVAIDMAVSQPSTMLGIAPDRIEPGQPANLIQFDLEEPSAANPSGFSLQTTIVDGSAVWQRP